MASAPGIAKLRIAVVGGGIAGLGFALALHQRGLACDVYESVPQVRELGVGITLLPHAMRELAALGLQAELEAAGIENLESVFFNRFGQFIYREPRGRHAGYPMPEVGIHRGKLHRILFDAACRQLGTDRIHTNRRCVGMTQDADGAHLSFVQGSDGTALPPVDCDLVVACDGIHSALRKQFYPDEKLAFAGINTWRGVTRHAPILTGKSYMRVGSIKTGKMVIYPIVDSVDEQGRQLVNWMAEIEGQDQAMNDWNTGGKVDDFLSPRDAAGNPGRPAGGVAGLRGPAARDHGAHRADQPRVAAGFHQYPGRRTRRGQTVPSYRRRDQPGRVARNIGELQADRRILAGVGQDLTPSLAPIGDRVAQT